MNEKEKKAAVSTDHAKATCATKAEKKSSSKKKDWVRLEEERGFGSITGAGIRVWGE
jgi:hypothetical protein